MNPPDLKRLIASFFLLATVIVSSTFAFLHLSSETSSDKSSFKKSESLAVVRDTKNAFVEPLTEPVEAETPSNVLLGNNLTERLIAALGTELEHKNPTGPKLSSEGSALTPPNLEEAIQDMLAADPLERRDIPDWEEELSQERINALLNPNSQDFIAYEASLNKILEKHFLANGLDVTKPDFGGDVDPRAFPFQKVAQELTALSVPEPLTGFHWSLVKLMNYESRVMALLDGAGEDPLKAAAILQAQEKNYFAAIQLLQNEAQKASTIRGFSYGKTPNSFFAQISSLFEIKTAHALFGIGDISFDPANLARMVWEFVRKIATEQLKTQLVHKLVAQTITWIQGGGKPQFITNWKGFLKDTAKLSVDQTLSRLYPNLCQSFGPLIRVAVLPVDPARDNPPTCTIDRIVANVQDFAQSFDSGGWIAYGAALEPENNFFGSLIQTNELVMQEAAQEVAAAEANAQASGGAKPTVECVKHGPSTGYLRGVPVPGPCIEWRDTTPGSVITGILNDSFAVPLARIVNAQDLTALVNALINSALSKLVQLGKNSVSKGLLGIQPFNPETDACAGLTGDDLVDCKNSWQPVRCTPTSQTIPVQIDNVNVNTASGTANGSGTGTITNPNAVTCTGGAEPPSDGGGDSCRQENCGGGCFCKVHDGLTAQNFCFLNDVVSAQEEVAAEYQASLTPVGQIDPTTGLINGPYNGCNSNVCVGDHERYKAYVAQKLRNRGFNVLITEEICVTGTCDNPVCSTGSGTDCPRPRAAGECLPTGLRRECTKIESSFNTIIRRSPNAICPG